MEYKEKAKTDAINRLFANLQSIRSRGDELRWKAMAFAGHRTKESSRASDCPVPDIKLYDCTGVMAIKTLVESLGGAVMSPNQDWFSIRIVPRNYKNTIPLDWGQSWISYAKKTMANELNHSNFYEEQSLAFFDSITCGYSCTLFQNDSTRNRLFLQTLEPWNCWFDTDTMGNYSIFFYRYTLDGTDFLERFGDEYLPKNIRDKAEKGGKEATFNMLYCITERPYLRDSQGRQIPFSQRIGKQMKYAAITILRDENIIIRESGFTEFPLVIHVWERCGDSQYGIGLVMKYLSELGKLNRTAYEYGLSVAKMNHGAWLVPSTMMNSFSDDPESRIPYSSADLSPRPLQEPVDINAAGEQLALQQQYITKLFYNDIFAYLLNQDKVFTATQVNAVKSEGMARIYPIYSRMQSQKIDPSLNLVYRLMVRSGRLQRPDAELYVGSGKRKNKLEFILDSAMSQMMQRYQAQTANSVCLDLYTQLAALNLGGFAQKYMDLGNLIISSMQQVGADASLFVTEEKRKRMEEEEKAMQQQMMQQQMALTESEVNRNNAGAANLNNRAGANGGYQ